MAYLLAYLNGDLSYGLSTDLESALIEAEDLCNEKDRAANLVERTTMTVVAHIVKSEQGYKAQKVEE